jgi:hypothetical protein
MNEYLIKELELFLDRIRRDEVGSLVIAASMKDGRSLAAWEAHDMAILGTIEFVKHHVLNEGRSSRVLESEYEKDTAQGHQQTQVETIQDTELREARPEAS